MPGKDELPSTLRRSPRKAQETWAATHDSAVGTYGEGERAHRTAFAALKHAFEKVGDHWEPKTPQGPVGRAGRGQFPDPPAHGRGRRRERVEGAPARPRAPPEGPGAQPDGQGRARRRSEEGQPPRDGEGPPALTAGALTTGRPGTRGRTFTVPPVLVHPAPLRFVSTARIGAGSDVPSASRPRGTGPRGRPRAPSNLRPARSRRRRGVTALAVATVPAAAAAGAVPASTARHDHGPRVVGPYKHLVVIYEENHSFDNLYGGWGRVGGQQVDGLQDAPPAHHRAACTGRHAVPLPAAGRRQPHLAAAAGHVHRPRARRARSDFRNRPFTHRPLHRPDGHHLPRARCLRPQRRPRRARAAGRAAPVTSCTASTRSSTRSTAAGRTATSPAATPSG